jgi:release factor glutamine methyltransferase
VKPLLEVLRSTESWFREKGIPSPRLDATLLIGHVLGLDRVKVYLAFDRPLTDDELERLRPLVRRRGAREPLAWILGSKEFYGREFIVTPGVLVPRPDTETLIEAALEWLPTSPSGDGGAKPPRNAPPAPVKRVLPWSEAVVAESLAKREDDAPAGESEASTSPPLVPPGEGGAPAPDEGAKIPPISPLPPEPPPVYLADVGSGTGCIGLTLALERPTVRLYAVDKEEAPLAATRANVSKHALDKRVAVLRGDLLSAIPANRPIDWVVSNPPYIPDADIAALEPEVRTHEPRAALEGGADGLDVYRRLVPAAAARVRQGVIFEVGAGQAAAVAELLRVAGFAEVRVWKDLAGVERVVGARRAPV